MSASTANTYIKVVGQPNPRAAHPKPSKAASPTARAAAPDPDKGMKEALKAVCQRLTSEGTPAAQNLAWSIAATAGKPSREWSPEFRQVAQQIAKNPSADPFEIILAGADAIASSEWKTLSTAEKEAWIDEKAFVSFKTYETRQAARER
jgi:hypothetical protein